MDQALSDNTLKMLTEAGVAIAALFVLLAVLFVLWTMVKTGFTVLENLNATLDRIAISETKQTSELANVKESLKRQDEDIRANGEAIHTLESKLEQLPEEVRAEVTTALDGFLDAVARVIYETTKTRPSKHWPFK